MSVPPDLMCRSNRARRRSVRVEVFLSNLIGRGLIPADEITG